MRTKVRKMEKFGNRFNKVWINIGNSSDADKSLEKVWNKFGKSLNAVVVGCHSEMRVDRFRIEFGVETGADHHRIEIGVHWMCRIMLGEVGVNQIFG